MTSTLQHLDGRPQTWEELHRRNTDWWDKQRNQKRQDADRTKYVRLASTAAPYFDCHPDMILGPSHLMLPSMGRQALWTALYRHGWTQERIGKAAKRTHGSISNGIKRINKRNGGDEFTQQALKALQEELNA
jgi:hypothetical protein